MGDGYEDVMSFVWNMCCLVGLTLMTFVIWTLTYTDDVCLF